MDKDQLLDNALVPERDGASAAAEDGPSGVAELGKRIRDARRRKNLSLREVASRTKVTRSVLSTIERGEQRRSNWSELQRIATVVGLDLELRVRAAHDQEQPLGLDSQIHGIMRGLAESCRARSRDDDLAAVFLEYGTVTEAICEYRNLVRDVLADATNLMADTGQVGQDTLDRAMGIYLDRLKTVKTDHLARGWLLHDFGRLHLLLAELAHVGKVKGDAQDFLTKAKALFGKSLHEKSWCSLPSQFTLPTKLKIVEVDLDTSYFRWIDEGVVRGEFPLGVCVAQLNAIAASYGECSSREVRERGISDCDLLLAKAFYMIGQVGGEGWERQDAFETAKERAESARAFKASHGDMDGELKAEALLARCRHRLKGSPSIETHSRHDAYLRNPELAPIEDLRTICAILMLRRETS